MEARGFDSKAAPGTSGCLAGVLPWAWSSESSLSDSEASGSLRAEVETRTKSKLDDVEDDSLSQGSTRLGSEPRSADKLESAWLDFPQEQDAGELFCNALAAAGGRGGLWSGPLDDSDVDEYLADVAASLLEITPPDSSMF